MLSSSTSVLGPCLCRCGLCLAELRAPDFHANICSPMPAPAKLITCVLLPRFELVVAAGGRTEILGVPAAIAPEPGSQQVGAVSATAEAFGVSPGMRLGEALARCHQLTLIPPDPAGVEERWEQMLISLESIGAAVEPLRPGLACFDARGLLRLHAGATGRGLAASALGRIFGVSNEVILRRLLTAGRTSQAFYMQRRGFYGSLIDAPAPADTEAEFKRNMPQEVVSDIGRPLTRLVLESYDNSYTSLADVSRYLGLRAQQVDKLRGLLAGS